jgi:Lrp/AsnC family leucine-responsive transcriptional regulator
MAEYTLDEMDRKILAALHENSRESASEIARRVGLTRQSVTERIERLRSEGVLRRFTVEVAPEKLGCPIRAYMAITMIPSCSEKMERDVLALLEANPHVQECYRVTGDDYFQIRILAPNIEVLKDLVLMLRETRIVQHTRTMLALETLFEKSAPGLPF